MTASPARALSSPFAMPLIAAGGAVLAFGLATPFGSYLASAFAEGWLAIYLDGAASRLLCI